MILPPAGPGRFCGRRKGAACSFNSVPNRLRAGSGQTETIDHLDLEFAQVVDGRGRRDALVLDQAYVDIGR